MVELPSMFLLFLFRVLHPWGLVVSQLQLEVSLKWVQWDV